MDELIEEARQYLDEANNYDRGMNKAEVVEFMTLLLLHLSIEEAKKHV